MFALACCACAVVTCALSACTPKQQPHPATAPEAPPAPRVTELPLSAHLPGVGLRWLVHLKPGELLQDRRLVEDWAPVFASDRIDAFTQASGVDPRAVSEAWIAGYDLGTLYLFDGSRVGKAAEEAFLARSLTTSEVESEYGNLSHYTGMMEQTPHALVHVHGHFVAIASGDIRLARIVRAYAEEKLSKSPPALGSRFLEPLAGFAEHAPLRAFLSGPYEGATDAVAGGFISGALAIDLQLDNLSVTARGIGAWPRSAELDQQMTHYLDQLFSTRELRALGWGFPTVAPTIHCNSYAEDLVACEASGAWNSADIAQALHRITAGSLKEIIEESPAGWHPEATTEDSQKKPDSASQPPASEQKSE